MGGRWVVVVVVTLRLLGDGTGAPLKGVKASRFFSLPRYQLLNGSLPVHKSKKGQLA